MADGIATGYAVDNVLSCGRCLPQNNSVGRSYANVAVGIATVAEFPLKIVGDVCVAADLKPFCE